MRATGEVRFTSDVVLSGDFSLFPAVTAGGTIDLGGAKLTSPLPSVFEGGHVYTLVLNNGTAPVNGTFAGLPEGALYARRFVISYHGGDGNDVTLTDRGTPGAVASTLLLDFPRAIPGGQTFTLPIQVSPAAGGTVRIVEGSTELANVPVTNGVTSATLTLAHGPHTLEFIYSGDATALPTEKVVPLVALWPAAVLTSIDPQTVSNHGLSVLTLHGENFRPESVVRAAGVTAIRYISPTELRVWYRPFGAADVQIGVEQTEDFPTAYSNVSNLLVLHVVESPAAHTALVFEEKAVAAHVTPRATTTWFMHDYDASPSVQTKVIVDDGDGVVRWKLDKPVSRVSNWAVVDQATRQVISGRPDGSVVDFNPVPENFALRDAEGNFSHVILPVGINEVWYVLWVRPGVGSWLARVADGEDADGTANQLALFDVSSFAPVETSGAPVPAGFAPGDLLIGDPVNGSSVWPFAGSVDDELTAPNNPGILGFGSGSDRYTGEAAGMLRVPVLRQGGTEGTVAVSYRTIDVTAHAGTQFQAVTGTLTFAPGEIVKFIDVPIVDDHGYADLSYFRLMLENAQGAAIGPYRDVHVFINDDEPKPVLSLEQPSFTEVVEGDSGFREIPLTIVLSAPYSAPLTVHYHWSTPNFEDGSGTFVVAPGELRKSFVVPIPADTLPEADMPITISVAADPAVLHNTTTTILLRDDDNAVVSVFDRSVREDQQSVEVMLTLSKRSARPVTITYTTSDRTARAGADYEARTGTITLTEPITQISIPIVNDGTVESGDWFAFTITQVNGALAGRTTAAITIVDDDDPGPGGARRRSARH